jgi:hypothetical protein
MTTSTSATTPTLFTQNSPCNNNYATITIMIASPVMIVLLDLVGFAVSFSRYCSISTMPCYKMAIIMELEGHLNLAL